MLGNRLFTRFVAWGATLFCVAVAGLYLWYYATQSYQAEEGRLLSYSQQLVDSTSRRIKEYLHQAGQAGEHFVIRHSEQASELGQPQVSSTALIDFGQHVISDLSEVQAFVVMDQGGKIHVKSDEQFVPDVNFFEDLEASSQVHILSKTALVIEDGQLLLDFYSEIPDTDLYFILRRNTDFLIKALVENKIISIVCAIVVSSESGSQLVLSPTQLSTTLHDILIRDDQVFPAAKLDFAKAKLKVVAMLDPVAMAAIHKGILIRYLLIWCLIAAGVVLPMWLMDKTYLSIRKKNESLVSENGFLQYQSLHDPLTNSANRTLLDERLGQAILTGQRTGEMFAVLIIDLDKFKPVNDTLGHAVGDQILQEIAERLRDPLRETDTIARIGGDEFAALVRIETRDQVALIAGKLLDQFDSLFEVGGTMLAMSASIGVAVFPDHGRSGSELLEHADIAMYQAKGVGSQFAVYNPKFDPNILDRLALIGSLREAINNDELILYYQPKVSVSDGSLVGLEALVRWQHPKHGMLMPSEFLPLAEQSGVIRLLTEKTIQRALNTCARLNLLGYHISIAVNLAPRAIHNCDFPDSIRGMLKEWNIQPDQLSFEVTEGSSIPDSGPTLAVLEELHAMGIRLSIDDFGMGYSALSYLKRLPVDELKIDKSFVLTMMSDARDAAVVQSTIDLAHRFGFDVVAEGVETKDVYDQLALYGCDIMQGTLISRPLDEPALEKWLNNGARFPT